MKLLFAVGAALFAVGLSGAPRPSVSPGIDRIASLLPERPSACGARASNRSAWDRLAADPKNLGPVRGAAAALKQPVPALTDEMYREYAQTGRRDRFEKPYKDRNLILQRLVMGECLEHKGRFLPKICEYLEAIFAETTWVLPAHDKNCLELEPGHSPTIDLGAAARAVTVAYAADWLRDELPPELVKRAYDELNRRIYTPYDEICRVTEPRPGGTWWFMGRNNWNAVVNGSVVRSALAMEPSCERRARFVDAALRANPYYLDGFEDDGYCSEGIGYWNYGFGHQLKLGLALRAATGGKLDLFAGEKQRKIMEYAYAYQLENGLSPDFADGSMGKPEPAMLALCRQVWPDCFSSAALKDGPMSGGIETVALRAFGQEPASAGPTMDRLPTRSWLPSAQVLIARLDPKVASPAFALAAKGGYNDENHNHNDVGSYEISFAGETLAGDPGAEKYTAKTFSKQRYESKINNSFGHPVPVVGGILQGTGAAYRAKVVSHDFTDRRDTLVLDIAGAYDVQGLEKLVRTFVFDREKTCVTVTDHVEFSRPSTFVSPIVSRVPVLDLGERRWLLNGRWSALEAEVTASVPVEFSREVIPNPERVEPVRISVETTEPVLRCDVTVRFRPCKSRVEARP